MAASTLSTRASPPSPTKTSEKTLAAMMVAKIIDVTVIVAVTARAEHGTVRASAP